MKHRTNLRAWAAACCWIACLACGDSGTQTDAGSQTGTPFAGTAAAAPAGTSGGVAGTSAAGTTAATSGTGATPTGRAGTGAAPTGTAGTATTGAAGASAGAAAPVAGTGASTAGAPAPTAGTGAATAGTGAAGGPATNEPCTGTLKPGDSTHQISIGGMMRTYLLHVPSKYTGTERVPLLIDLHPLTQSASFQKRSSGYQQQSDANNFIVAWPDGIDAAWNIGPCCTRSRELDDLGFIRGIVDEIKKSGCVDNSRVYAAGFSMGGGLSHHLACMASDVFAAVSPAAFDLIEENVPKCTPSRGISVKSFRGTADLIVPYAGGESRPPTAYPLDPIHFLGAEGTFKKWAEINGCTDTPSDADGCKAYKQCKDGVEVQLCTKTGGSHETGDAVSGWKFLSRFQLK